MSSFFYPIVDPIGDTQFNFDQLASLLIDTGGVNLSLRVGVGTLTFAAGAGVSGTVSIPHGLGTTPAGVVAFQNGTGGPSPVVGQASNLTSTTFDLYGEFRTGTWAAGGTIPFAWIAWA